MCFCLARVIVIGTRDYLKYVLFQLSMKATHDITYLVLHQNHCMNRIFMYLIILFSDSLLDTIRKINSVYNKQTSM